MTAVTPMTADEIAALLEELARVRAESAERWAAIGRLAPAAKASRERAEDAHRLLAELVAALATPLDDAARAVWVARIGRALGRGAAGAV